MKSIILTHSSCGLINYFNTLPPKKPSAPTPYPLPQQGKLSAVFFRHRTDFNVGALKIKLVSYSHTHLFLALHEKRRWPIWISKYGRSKFILSGCFRDAQTGFILATFRFANVGRLSLVLLFLFQKPLCLLLQLLFALFVIHFPFSLYQLVNGHSGIGW